MKKSTLSLISVATIGVLAVGAYFGAQQYANKILDQRLQDMVQNAKDSATITYESSHINLLSQSATIKNISITPEFDKQRPVTIDSVTIHEMDRENDFPHLLSLSMTGVNQIINPENEADKELIEYGYSDKLVSDVALEYAYQKSEKTLNIKQFRWDTNDAFVISLNGELNNVVIEGESPLFSLIMGMYNIELVKAKIGYQDQSFFTRVQKAQAKSDDISIEALKAKSIKQIDAAFEGVTLSAKMTAIISKVKAFIENPTQLTLSAQPDAPVTVEQIIQTQSADAAIELLKLTAE